MTTILIVDDNAQNLYMLKVLLQAHSYSVQTADNGAEALAIARTQAPDMIISDILMPIMDGFTLCRHFKTDPQLREIPFIFYTAEYTDLKDQELAISLGVKRFIIKPAEPNTLIAIVREVLDEKPLSSTDFLPSESGDSYFREYNEALIRKLEDKMQQIEAANRRLLGLQEASAAMTGSLGLEEVLQRIARSAIEALDCNAVWILVVDEETDRLESKVLIGVSDGHILALQDALGLTSSSMQIASFSKHNWLIDAMLCQEPIVIADINDLEYTEGLPNTLFDLNRIINFHSLIILPMLPKENRIVGMMILTQVNTGEIADDEMGLITAFAHQAAIAIENARLFDKIERSERRYRTILENSADAIISLDSALNITDWNLGAEKIFGYLAADIIGQPWEILAPNAIKPDLYKAIDKVKRKGYLRGWRTRQINKANRLLDVEITITDLGSELGFSTIVTDISDRLAKEAQLLHAQKLEAVGQLVGGIAHDFNNLLTVILGNLKFLSNVFDVTTPKDIREPLEDALSASRDSTQLTQRLLAFSRRQPLEPKRIEINHLIGDVGKLLRRTLSPNIEINITMEPNVGAAIIDPFQLESALLNLCINARDAMPKGGVLSICTAYHDVSPDTDARPLALPPGTYIAITISDTGTGMSSETISHVCEPFFTTKGVGKGSGLGLSMVYGFVKQSKGELIIESELGKGTTLTLLLPQAQADDDDFLAAEMIENSPERASHSNKRYLS